MNPPSHSARALRRWGRALVPLCAAFGCKPAPPPAPAPAHEPAGGHAASAMEGHHHRGGHHRFDDAEAWAKQFDDPARDEWQKPDEVVAWMGLATDATVADIGAGTGYFAVRLARAVPAGTVLANDIEPDMVRYLGERAAREGVENLVPVQGAAESPGLDRPVDVVFLCDVYHHIANRTEFFAGVREVLAPGGRVVIVDFRPDAPADAPGPPAAMRIAADDVVAELAPAGFSKRRLDRDMLQYQYVLELEVSVTDVAVGE